VRDGLTVLRAHALAGRPAAGTRLLGSFEAWSAVVPAALAWLGCADPLESRPAADAGADRTKAALVGLLDGWARLDPLGQGLTVAHVLRLLYPERRFGEPRAPDAPGVEELREAVETIAPSIGGKPPSSVKLGLALRGFRKRVVGGRMFECKATRTGVAAWLVVGTRARFGNPAAGAAWGACDAGDVSLLRPEKEVVDLYPVAGSGGGNLTAHRPATPSTASTPCTVDDYDAAELEERRAIQELDDEPHMKRREEGMAA
jgi:hypothetical protein